MTTDKSASIKSLLERAASMQKNGQMQETVNSLQQVLLLEPGHYQALAILAHLAMAGGQPLKAEQFAKQALATDPDGFGALAIMTQCLQAKGDFKQAHTHMEKAAEQHADNDKIWFNLGVLSEQQGKSDQAMIEYGKAVALNEENFEALAHLTMLEIAARDNQQALQHCQQLLSKQRGQTGAALNSDDLPQLPPHESQTTRFKLEHDQQQLTWLLARDLVSDEYQTVVDAIAQVLADVGDEYEQNEVFERLHPRHKAKAHWQLLNQHYNRPAHIPEPQLDTSELINPDLDIEAIQAGYKESDAGIIVVDDFLRPGALEALRDYCTAATIWYDVRKNYLGAYLTQGFANALTLGIAGQLQDALPEIFAKHQLTQSWAYKYGPKYNGIGIHADAAAVNCNFWITANEANLNPENGGLLLYSKHAPKDWDFDKFNNDDAAIAAHLGDDIDNPIRITYRENRIVIFNSDLFHRTDKIEFADDFESRRVNVTMLFGRRKQS